MRACPPRLPAGGGFPVWFHSIPYTTPSVRHKPPGKLCGPLNRRSRPPFDLIAACLLTCVIAGYLSALQKIPGGGLADMANPIKLILVIISGISSQLMAVLFIAIHLSKLYLSVWLSVYCLIVLYSFRSFRSSFQKCGFWRIFRFIRTCPKLLAFSGFWCEKCSVYAALYGGQDWLKLTRNWLILTRTS